MTRSVKQAAPELVTDWYPGSINPARPGYYWVRNSELTHWRHTLVGAKDRYWDGKNWLSGENGKPSIFGRHSTHQWRGVRRWVLVSSTMPFMVGSKMYLTSARSRAVKASCNLVDSRPFKTEAAAQRFGDRYSRLGLTAMLP